MSMFVIVFVVLPDSMLVPVLFAHVVSIVPVLILPVSIAMLAFDQVSSAISNACFFCAKYKETVKIMSEKTNIHKINLSFFESSCFDGILTWCMISGFFSSCIIFLGLPGPSFLVFGFLEMNSFLGLPRVFFVLSAISLGQE